MRGPRLAIAGLPATTFGLCLTACFLTQLAMLCTPLDAAACMLRRRSYTGQCTNTAHPTWGTAGTAQPAIFRRTSASPAGQKLPSARVLSNILSASRLPDDPTPVSSRRVSEFSVFFSQFLDHDLLAVLDNKNDLLPIAADPSDKTRSTSIALKFLRSQRDPVSGHPVNSASGPIDLSMVYGSDRARAKLLRTFSGGRLRHSRHDLLSFNSFGMRNAPNASSPLFFFSGDHRANEHPMLTTLHTVFSREHNRLADEVSKLHPGWSDARVFAAARAVNIAQMQAVVYEEFLPSMLGRKSAASLAPYTGFKAGAHPAASVIFGTAAFRVGHSMVAASVARKLVSGRVVTESLFKSFFNAATQFETRANGGVEPLLRAATTRVARNVDLFVVQGLRDALFKNVRGMHEFDLVALNIQRGRDHALPSYNAVRAAFGLKKAASFADIAPHDVATRRRLSLAYRDVDNVEAWVGMLAEPHLPGSALGALAAAVWKRQFEALRDGDARFYQREEALRAFGIGELPSVVRLRRRKFNMRKLLLDNSRLGSAELPTDLWRVH